MQSLTFNCEPEGAESRTDTRLPSGEAGRQRPGAVAWSLVVIWLVSMAGWMAWLNPITAADVAGTCSTAGSR